MNAPDDATRTKAHVLPFAVFMVFLIGSLLASSLVGWDHPAAPWWRRDPAHWLYPVQCLVVGFLLVKYRRVYEFRWSWKWSLAGVAMGAIGIGFWLLPTATYDWLGLKQDPGGWMKHLGVAARRDDGFDPGIFTNPVAWWATVIARVFRAVVIVALVEEIFWRGFLMRFANDWEGDYWRQPFGKGTWMNYLVTTGAFVAAHAPVDYAGAFVYGSLTWLFCVWGKNLSACVIMHATANLLMCLYILQTGKIGLW